MKRHIYVTGFVLLCLNSTCWAYGGGGGSSSKSCEKAKFSQFAPAEKSEVAPGSKFSFIASKNTLPTTIKVTVKDRETPIKVEKKNDSTYAVSGTLPPSVKGSFARIAIHADAQSQCNGTGGWLVKISE